MKSVCLHGVMDLRNHDEPIPAVGVGEILIRVRSIGICGADVLWFWEGGIGDAQLEHSLILGHEFAGETEKEALEIEEDIGLAQFAEIREKTFKRGKSLKHHEVW